MATKITLNGKEITIPTETTSGAEIKKLMNIASDRKLIRQESLGNMIITELDIIELKEGDFFSDAPNFKYG